MKQRRTLQRSSSIKSVEDVGEAATEGPPEVQRGSVCSSAQGPRPIEQFIQIRGNFGVRSSRCTFQGRTDADSDTEASKGTVTSMDAHVMTVRSNSLKHKHGVNIMISRGRTDAGSGLFSARGFPVGHEIEVKGPIYENEATMLKWIDAQSHTQQDVLRTSALFARRSLLFTQLRCVHVFLHCNQISKPASEHTTERARERLS